MEHDIAVVSDRPRDKLHKTSLVVDAEENVLCFPIVPVSAKPLEGIAPGMLDSIVVETVFVGVRVYRNEVHVPFLSYTKLYTK